MLLSARLNDKLWLSRWTAMMKKKKDGKVGKAKAQEETSSLDCRERFLAGRDRIQEKEVNDKEIYQIAQRRRREEMEEINKRSSTGACSGWREAS
jgi:hypothetical protein